MMGVVCSSLSQQVASCCNRVAKRTQHVTPNKVAMLSWHVVIVWPGP